MLLRSLAVLFLGCTLARAQAPERFPTDKSVQLKENGQRWWIDGRQELPSQARVENLKATVIEGRGAENVIALSGALVLRSPVEGKVVLRNVWIELQPEAKELYLSNCEFQGGGVRTAGTGAKEPKVFVELTKFDSAASFGMTLYSGEVDLQQTSVVQPVRIVGLPLSEKIANKASLGLLACRELTQGLQVDGVGDVLVRNCDLVGDSVRLANWLKLDFDGNNVRTLHAEFSLPVYGRFTTAKVHNCDFHVDDISFFCPTDGDKAEKWSLDHCYLRGLTDPAQIFEKLIRDHHEGPRVGVEVDCKRVCPSPLGLGGTTAR